MWAGPDAQGNRQPQDKDIKMSEIDVRIQELEAQVKGDRYKSTDDSQGGGGTPKARSQSQPHACN